MEIFGYDMNFKEDFKKVDSLTYVSYIVNDILNGVSDMDKLRDLFSVLKKGIPLKELIFESPLPLVVIKDMHREGSYGARFYKNSNGFVSIEWIGYWKGYNPKKLEPDVPEKAHLTSMRIKLIYPNSNDLELRIESIIHKFPVKPFVEGFF